MVKVRKDLPLQDNGEVDIESWLTSHKLNEDNLIREAIFLSRLAGEDYSTPYGDNCFQESLAIAEIIIKLKLGSDAIAAALVFNSIEHAELSFEDVEQQLGKDVAALVLNVQAMQSITRLENNRSRLQVDNVRKMLLAMVRDARAVVIKLAERLCVMRALNHVSEPEQQMLAQETQDVYAPLASRLGVSELKWELEDLTFSILQYDTYKSIAKNLSERRIEREARVEMTISQLQHALQTRNIEGKVMGRAKHIYSIHRKMQRKKVPFNEIFDAMAVRVLVPETDDCYKILSFAHETWQPIKEEFDDYISMPKPNGYQSIHTAVKDQDGKVFELQIRTFQMHEESEMGVAAHWLYKEGTKSSSFDEKIKWLRQLLDWQKEVSDDTQLPQELERNVFEDRVYVFTPDGRIMDLVAGATPLDFAYYIHTEVGHRCRGVKINDHIAQLTQTLKLGDRVEILTGKHSNPSRDWLIPSLGYLKTPKARAKVSTWFKQQDFSKHVDTGKQLLEREIHRLNLSEPNIEKLATQLKYPTAEKFFAALGRGDLRIAHVSQTLIGSKPKRPELEKIITEESKKKNSKDISIYGTGDLLTQFANCCHPAPGDDIIGYITQGHGVTIHRKDCKNALHLSLENEERMIEVEWNSSTTESYPVRVNIKAYDRKGLLSDITQVMMNDKIGIHGLNTITDKKKQLAFVKLTIEIKSTEGLSRILDRINLIPNVISAQRAREQQV